MTRDARLARRISGRFHKRLLYAGAAALALAPLPAAAESAAEAVGLRGSQPIATASHAVAPPPAAPVAELPPQPIAPVEPVRETVTASAMMAPPRPDTPPAGEQVAADGLGPRDVYFEADVVIDNREEKTLTAQGSVEARYQGRTLRADEIVYNTETGVARARGNAVIINPDGSTEYSQDVVLDDELRTGVAIAFAAREQGNVSIAAAAAIRRNENVNELRNAIYTPCDICAGDGSPKSPTWSVQASQIVQDRERRVIYYRNAIIRVKGLPVFYTPIFWTPDPSAERRSGFLAPRFRYNARRGLSYEQPYLWVISPSNDLVISPQFYGQLNPLLTLEYRQRFWSGQLNARVGYTYERQFDSVGKYGDRTSRSYILADGLFQLDDKWRWGFGAERTSDPTLLARYSVDDVFPQRGPFTVDSQRLISQVYAARQDTNSFLQVSALSFQTLRVEQRAGRVIRSYDTDNAFPVVAPLIEARFSPAEKLLGGRLRAQGSAVLLHRDDRVDNLTPAGIIDNQTVDSRRVSGQLDWRAQATFASGIRVEPFAQARGDAYWINDRRPGVVEPKTSLSRGFVTAGADVSWPFIGRGVGGSSLILEPLLQVAVSPDYKPSSRLPNEDSRSLYLDPSNLFSTNRFTGFDLFEGGQRVNVGGRATWNWGAGRSASVLVGRSFRADPSPAFFLGSGLEGKSSDWVTSVTLDPIQGLSLFSRTRFDEDDFHVRRQEAGVNLNLWRVAGSARYLYNERDFSGVATQSLVLAGTANITKNWGVGILTSRDLEAGLAPFTQYSLFYQDECVRIDILFNRDETVQRTIVPASSIQVRLTLATLGGQGR